MVRQNIDRVGSRLGGDGRRETDRTGLAIRLGVIAAAFAAAGIVWNTLAGDRPEPPPTTQQ